MKGNLVAISPKLIEKMILEPETEEAKLVKKFGNIKGREIITKITNSEKVVQLKKRDEKLTLKFNRQKQKSKSYLLSELYIEAYNKDGLKVATLTYNLQGLHVVRLNYIEILDKNYINQGLASIMLEELENIARITEINAITGKLMPMGEFKNFSRKFYERNGFTIEFDPGEKMEVFYKNLQPLEYNL